MSASRTVGQTSLGEPRYEAIPYLVDERTGTYFDKSRQQYRVLAFSDDEDQGLLLGTFDAELPDPEKYHAERRIWERFIFAPAPTHGKDGTP